MPASNGPIAAEKSEGHAGGDVVLGPEHGQDANHLHGQDQTQRQGGHRHQREGLDPQVVHLGDDFPEEPGRVRQGAAGLQEKQGQIPHIIHEAHDRVAGAVKKPVLHERPAHPKKYYTKCLKLTTYRDSVKEKGPDSRAAPTRSPAAAPKPT